MKKHIEVLNILEKLQIKLARLSALFEFKFNSKPLGKDGKWF